MSKLGLGLAAYGGYQARDRQIKAEDYQDRQRAYGTAQMDANQPGLADAAAARDSGNRLSAAQNTAELGLVPQRAEIASSQLGFQKEQLPRQQQTARQQTDMQGQASDQEYKDFGNKLRQQRISNAIGQQDANDQAMAKLADVLHTSQSPQQAVQFYNAVVDTGALGDMPGPKATSVRMSKTPDGREEIAFFNGDQRIFGMDQTTMGRYLARGQKLDVKEVKAGHNLVGVNTRTGTATELYKAPESASEKASKKPAEVATMDWMVEKGVAKDANDAWNKLRTAREKGRSGFVADMMKGAIMPGMSEEDLRKQETAFGAMFDRLNGGGRPSASNSNPANTLDPKVASLFD
ncbi:hypothetical protein LJR296_001473 [Cupriavidus necator]|uniref:hypothetical protein n=1 Tax=Cupriavidus necator TaxID=106590 RepID=UPI003ECD903C